MNKYTDQIPGYSDMKVLAKHISRMKYDKISDLLSALSDDIHEQSGDDHSNRSNYNRFHKPWLLTDGISSDGDKSWITHEKIR